MRNGVLVTGWNAYQDYVVFVDFKASRAQQGGASVPTVQARCTPSGALAQGVAPAPPTA